MLDLNRSALAKKIIRSVQDQQSQAYESALSEIEELRREETDLVEAEKKLLLGMNYLERFSPEEEYERLKAIGKEIYLIHGIFDQGLEVPFWSYSEDILERGFVNNPERVVAQLFEYHLPNYKIFADWVVSLDANKYTKIRKYIELTDYWRLLIIEYITLYQIKKD